MTDLYIYKEESSDTLNIELVDCGPPGYAAKPIIWAQDGRYGFISKEQVRNMMRRKKDLAKQQKGYAKDKPLDLVFHWEDTVQMDPVIAELMREALLPKQYPPRRLPL